VFRKIQQQDPGAREFEERFSDTEKEKKRKEKTLRYFARCD